MILRGARRNIVTAATLQKVVISLFLQKAPMRTHVATLASFILPNSVTHVTKKTQKTVFGINPSQTGYKSMYFVPELISITSRLLRKDLSNISLQLFAIMGSRMTNKSIFEQTEPTAGVINMFRMKSFVSEMLISSWSFLF